MEQSPKTPESIDSEKDLYKKAVRRKILAANVLHGAQPSPEHIGHVLVAAESKTDSDKKPESAGKRLSERQVETLSRAELLILSEKIIIDGTSLRQIYETHLIGERGLRRLAAEHFSGGDIKKALRQEIVERELDFERDPALRNRLAKPKLSTTLGNDKTIKMDLKKLLEQASGNSGDNNEEAAFFKARAEYESEQFRQHQQQRQVMDRAFVIIIFVLLVFVILLVLTRG